MNTELTDNLQLYIGQLLDSDFTTYSGVHKVILSYYKKMENFINSFLE
jgi:hypothetical protein